MNPEHGMQVSLKPDILFKIGEFPITNTFIESVLFSVFLIILVVFVVKKSNLRPSKFQLILEFFINSGYNFTKDTLEDEKMAKKVYPLLASLFFVILFFNLMKFLPGLESITYNHTHLFKAVHSDLNMTLALGIVA
jgi:F-type H+-transporting ATPase subunit a